MAKDNHETEAKWLIRARAEALAEIHASRRIFDEVVKRADATGDEYNKAFVTDVRASFDDLRTRIGEASREEFEFATESAEELERLRAYVMPKREIVVDGRMKLATMAEWGVPSGVLDKLAIETLPMLSSPDVRVSRAGLRAIYSKSDYWDWYVEEHARVMQTAGFVLLAIMLLSLVGAVFLLHFKHIYSGVFCAGVAGALLSVVAKLPPVMDYGDTKSYVSRMVSRVGMGIAASLIGMGLLASGIVSLELPGDISVAEMLNRKDLVNIDEIHAGDDPAQLAVLIEDKGRLSPRAVLLIMALAMLFGFSERALATFEEKVLPSRIVTATSMAGESGKGQIDQVIEDGNPEPLPPKAPKT